ncbi:MAG: rod shape-determining protein MreC [Myxococcota bacterium]
MNYFRRFRDAALCVALLALPFFFLSANLKDASNVNMVDRLVLQASAPVQFLATQIAHAVSDVLEEYVYLVDVKREHERLRAENDRLRQEQLELRIHAQDNERLRELLSLRPRLGGETWAAQVIAKETSAHFRVVRIRLDRGERDEIREGMPVVSTEGLVGQIRRTWGRYADVQLTVDQRSAIDVVLERGRARGILRGTGADEYACRIEYLERTDEVQPGDEVYTSGLGQRFPSSILVGRVRSVVQREHGLYQEALVTPAVNFSALQEVLVLGAMSTRRRLEHGEDWDHNEQVADGSP